MGNIAWLMNEKGCEKVTVLREDGGGRTVQVEDGERKGLTLTIPPDGIPYRDCNPALHYGDETPQVWRFKGRSLRVRKPEEFADPEQAKALVPQQEPYTFLPHTTQAVDGILAGDHQLLFGPTGVGKTSLILSIAARIGQPVIRLNLNGQVSVSDLVGSVGFGPQGTKWNDGALPRAMRNGYWLLLDEIDFGSPDVLSVFYPVLEPKPRLCLKEHDGEVVEADPRFRIFATGNSIGGDGDGRYHGTQPMNAAFLNRFTGHGQVIKVEAMSQKQEREVLRQRMPNLSGTLVKRACDFAARLRQSDGQHAALLPTFSTRELINYCQKLVLYRDPIRAANLTFLSVVEDGNVRQPIEEAVKLLFGKRVIIGRAPGSFPHRMDKTAATTTKPMRASVAPAAAAVPKTGRVASEITDEQELRDIWSAYKGNGGTLSFAGIERRFGLRQSHGATAYRLVKRYEATAKRSDPAAATVAAPAEETP